METLTTKEFRKFYEKSFKKMTSVNFTIHFRKQEVSKIGYSVSKKNHKLAVERNRIKRLLKAWIAESGAELASMELNLIVSKPLNLQDKSLILLKEELITLLKKIK